MSVAIIDYGSGNLHSARKAFERAARDAGASDEIKVTARPEDVLAADHVVLPGVGAFADCRRGLDGVAGMVEAMEEAARNRGRPFLGICVGAQFLATRGLEHEVVGGLNWIAGDVAPIKPRDPALEDSAHGVEHPRRSAQPSASGWDSGPARADCTPISSTPINSTPMTRATWWRPPTMAVAVTAIVARDNIAGTQFHPEKSQTLGLALIANFLRWRP